jgi:rhodanese-related sulfurtransferase
MRALLFSMTLMLSASVFADDMAMTPEQAYERVQDDAAGILFVDVRDPVEIMFVGFTDEVDVNVPFLIADRTRWNEERGHFVMAPNPDFLATIETALAAKGLDRTATIITLCRSGSDRGAPSARFLREQGFENARYVQHGFQGDPLEEGPQAGMRLKNGWQNAGLPWQRLPNPGKIYRQSP